MRNLIIAIVLLAGSTTLTAQSSIPMGKIGQGVEMKENVKKVDSRIFITNGTKTYYMDKYSSCKDYFDAVDAGTSRYPNGWDPKKITCSVKNGIVVLMLNPKSTIKTNEKDN